MTTSDILAINNKSINYCSFIIIHTVSVWCAVSVYGYLGYTEKGYYSACSGLPPLAHFTVEYAKTI